MTTVQSAADGLQGGRPPQEVEQAQVQRGHQDGQAQRPHEGVREGRYRQRPIFRR
jgi:hypothetical protein